MLFRSPFGLWSHTQADTDAYSNRELQYGSYTFTGIRAVTYAYSVRCVLDLTRISLETKYLPKRKLQTDSVTNCPVTVPCSVFTAPVTARAL